MATAHLDMRLIGEPEGGVWCETCLLPSAFSGT
jgi:hypothetical protein